MIAALTDTARFNVGQPEMISLDDGGEFKADVSKATLRKFKAQQRSTSPYNPEGYGPREVANETITAVVAKIRNLDCRGWA